MQNAFTVDVEDYYHVSAFESVVSRAQWEHYPSRVVKNTHRLLDLLEKKQVRATFFILGWVADKYPDLIRDVQRAGHEIGCHSYWHRLIYLMTPEQFREDLILSKDLLEQITGTPVCSYRAPSFSITQQSLWALDILAEQGFRYDSSIFPIVHDRYGIPSAERLPHSLPTQAGNLLEFPPSVYRILKQNVPVSGGGYFRLFPLQFSSYCLNQVNHSTGSPFMFYIHPWELDPDQPRIPASRMSRFRHYVNLGRTEEKVGRMLDQFQFSSMSEVLDQLSLTPDENH